MQRIFFGVKRSHNRKRTEVKLLASRGAYVLLKRSYMVSRGHSRPAGWTRYYVNIKGEECFIGGSASHAQAVRDACKFLRNR